VVPNDSALAGKGQGFLAFQSTVENSLPHTRAALSSKDDCKNRFYRQYGLVPFRKNRKNLLAAISRQTALSAKNAGKALFLSSTIYAQKMAGLFGEAGIIIRQSTGSPPR
jgi:hypothetical protein